jgi:hypothetical protein
MVTHYYSSEIEASCDKTFPCKAGKKTFDTAISQKRKTWNAETPPPEFSGGPSPMLNSNLISSVQFPARFVQLLETRSPLNSADIGMLPNTHC